MINCTEDDEPWEYVPVESADEVMSCGDVIECTRLKNWNRWLKIRKEQQKHLGLMVSFLLWQYQISSTDNHACNPEMYLEIDKRERGNIF